MISQSDNVFCINIIVDFHFCLTRYARAMLTQLLPTVERNLYERVDGEKPDPDSEPKPEKSSMFPGIVKMHREANLSENDEFFIKNKFNRSDVINMASDIDSDFCYRNWFVHMIS